MIDLMGLAKEYGLWAAVSMTLFPWVWSIDKRSRKMRGDLDNVHVSCRIPQGAFEELKLEVDELKESKQSMEIRYAVQESSLSEIKVDVKSMLSHFQMKGMDG